jgi:two-component system chemotaxis response regulator CheY
METPLQKTCLVVDDSSIVRRMAGAMFRELGYKVSEAANGLRAVEHCKAHSPDVVLLDWNMPVMDGLDCLRTLRSSGTAPTARIMLCTSESSVTKIQTVLEAGADEYIIKPFDREVLRDKLILLGLEEPA